MPLVEEDACRFPPPSSRRLKLLDTTRAMQRLAYRIACSKGAAMDDLIAEHRAIIEEAGHLLRCSDGLDTEVESGAGAEELMGAVDACIAHLSPDWRRPWRKTRG